MTIGIHRAWHQKLQAVAWTPRDVRSDHGLTRTALALDVSQPAVARLSSRYPEPTWVATSRAATHDVNATSWPPRGDLQAARGDLGEHDTVVILPSPSQLAVLLASRDHFAHHAVVLALASDVAEAGLIEEAPRAVVEKGCRYLLALGVLRVPLYH